MYGEGEIEAGEGSAVIVRSIHESPNVIAKAHAPRGMS